MKSAVGGMSSARKGCMESTRSVVCYQADDSNTRLRVMPYATSSQLHTMRKRIDYIPSLREPPKLARSLRGTPTAAWIKNSESKCFRNFLERVDKKDAYYCLLSISVFFFASSNTAIIKPKQAVSVGESPFGKPVMK